MRRHTLPALSRDSDLWRAYSEVAPAHAAFRDARGSPIRRRSSRCSTNCLPRQASVPDDGVPDDAHAQGRHAAVHRARTGISGRCAGSTTRSRQIAFDELDLDIYPVQIEIISSEQMLDAYSSVGLPLMYRHWSFGKHFAYHETLYRKGLQGLAYEIVINSNPCICYIMEENSMAMQTLVMAHAAFGHNHFFKNNYLFQQWTDAGGILDYLDFARDYVAKCEEQLRPGRGRAGARRGARAEGARRQPLRPPLEAEPRRGAAARRASGARTPRRPTTICGARCRRRRGRRSDEDDGSRTSGAASRQQLGLPEENLLYFIEKRAPRLDDWQRELIRIVRNVSQYFYPQKQLQMMNEGCATFCHYEIMNRLHDKRADHRRRDARIPALAFERRVPAGIRRPALQRAQSLCARLRDDERHPAHLRPSRRRRTASSSRTSPAAAMPYGVLRDAWANYRDESFILQYLSPAVIRKFRLFQIADDSSKPSLRVDAIHDELRLSPDPQRAVEAIRPVAPRARHPGRRCRSEGRPQPGAGAFRA